MHDLCFQGSTWGTDSALSRESLWWGLSRGRGPSCALESPDGLCFRGECPWGPIPGCAHGAGGAQPSISPVSLWPPVDREATRGWRPLGRLTRSRESPGLRQELFPQSVLWGVQDRVFQRPLVEMKANRTKVICLKMDLWLSISRIRVIQLHAWVTSSPKDFCSVCILIILSQQLPIFHVLTSYFKCRENTFYFLDKFWPDESKRQKTLATELLCRQYIIILCTGLLYYFNSAK